MTISKAFGILIASITLVGVIGGSAGYGLGRYFPSYYRCVFRAAHDSQFDAVSVGTSLGITQGLAGGAVVGLALVAILCWREMQIHRAPVEPSSTTSAAIASTQTQRSRAKALLLATGGLFLLGIIGACSFVVGAVIGECGAHHRRYLEERDAVAPALADKPEFANVQIMEQSNGGIWLLGEVADEEGVSRLQEIVQSKLGELRTEDVLSGIWVTE